MAYQETKTTGYGTRVSNSLKGIGIGFLLLLGGTALLWWNEGRTVQITQMLEEAQTVAVHVEDVSKPDPSLNGKLIHATAFTQTKDSLNDLTFGVGCVAIQLERKVQYYQWVEHSETETKDKTGGSQETVTTYYYKQEWIGNPVNSQEFKDPDYQNKNFVLMDIENKSYMAENVTFGAYKLPKDLIGSISGTVPMELSLSEERLSEWNRDIKKSFESTSASTVNNTVAVAGETSTIAEGDSVKVETVATTETGQIVKQDYNYVHVNGNVLYFGKNPNNPQIGDMSVTFTKVMPGEASVIAVVNGDKLQSYVAKNGKTLSVLTSGAVSMENMFENQHKSNSFMTWILRFIGLFLVVTGFKGIFGILVDLLKVLPFMADIVGLGVGLICKVLGLAWSLLIIAMAWLFYRPVIAGVLLAAIVALIVFLVKKGKDNKKAEVSNV